VILSDWVSIRKFKWKVLNGVLVLLLHSVQKVSFPVLSIHTVIWMGNLLKHTTGY